MTASCPQVSTQPAVSQPIVTILTNEEKQQNYRALSAFEYSEKFGFDTPADYIAAGCPSLLGPSHISGGLSASAETHPSQNEADVFVYTNELQVKRHVRSAGGGQRGTITGFSEQSRARMIRFFNRLHWPDVPCFFLTLTFPDEFPDRNEGQAQLRAFLKRLTADDPTCQYVWRREWKTRLSGDNKGKIAPHYHLFVWTALDEKLLLPDTRQDWNDIAGKSDPAAHYEHGFDIKPVTCRKQAVYYVTKYMEKHMSATDTGEVETGRLWGHSGGLDASPLLILRVTLLQVHALKIAALEFLQARMSAFLDTLADMRWWQGWHLFGLEETAADFIREALGTSYSTIPTG